MTANTSAIRTQRMPMTRDTHSHQETTSPSGTAARHVWGRTASPVIVKPDRPRQCSRGRGAPRDSKSAEVPGYRRGPVATEIRKTRDLRHATEARRRAPVMNGRQCFAGPRTKRHRFKPADTIHWIVAATLRITAVLPRRRPGPPCEIPKRGSLAALVRPPLIIGITAGIDESFEIAVGDFVAVNPEFLDLTIEPVDWSSSDRNHVRRVGADRFKRHTHGGFRLVAASKKWAFNSDEAVLREAETHGSVQGKADFGNWRQAKHFPRAVIGVRPDGDLRAFRVGRDRQWRKGAVAQLIEIGIVAKNAIDSAHQPKCFEPVPFGKMSRYVRQHALSHVSLTGPIPRGPAAKSDNHCGENH